MELRTFLARANGTNLALLAMSQIVLFLAIIVSARWFLRSLCSRLRAKQASPNPYLLQFPPSRQHVLKELLQLDHLPPQIEVTPEVLRSKALPTAKNSNLSQDTLYTPTGFSTEQIKALGRFPDYALLSGVPHPEPCSPAWEISKALSRPFRPFRWNYHQHMALLKYDPNYWVELTRDYHTAMSARHALLRAHPSEIRFQTPSPACDLAVRELAETLLQFLCRRYPQHFSLTHGNTLFHNRLLRTTTNLATTPPLRTVFDNIPEDYAVMLRSEHDGRYYLRAAAVCSSVGWHVGAHKDSPLRAIHGGVPDAHKMGRSMDRWFARLPTDAPAARCSWSLEDREVLFGSPAVAERAGRAAWQRSGFAGREGELTAADVRLRCDVQTLRRLPVSGAVVFNFKAVFTRLEELRDEPFVPALLGKVLREGKSELVGYKCEEHVRKVALGALDRWAAEQVQSGLVPADWEVTTLDESPFYPGWEEKWQRQQGFGSGDVITS